MKSRMPRMASVAFVVILAFGASVAIGSTSIVGSNPTVALNVSTPANLTTTINACCLSTFAANGLYWVFYLSGSVFYQTCSMSNCIWSTPTAVPTSGTFYASFWLQGNTVNYVSGSNSPSDPNFYFRNGTLSSSGTISWLIPERGVSTGEESVRYVRGATDSLGNNWVSVVDQDVSNTGHFQIYYSSSQGWKQSLSLNAKTSQGFPNDFFLGYLVPLTSGKMAVIYEESRGNGYYPNEDIRTCSGTGCTWSSPVQSSVPEAQTTATNNGDTIQQCGYNSKGTGDLDYLTFAYGSSAWNLAVVSSGHPSQYGGYDCAITTDGTNVAMLYSNEMNATYATFSSDGGLTWASLAAIDSGLAGSQRQTVPQTFSGVFAGMWYSDQSSPFTLRFATFSIGPPVTTSSSSTSTASSTTSSSTSTGSQFAVLSATGGPSGGTASVQSNLNTNSGPKTINYQVLDSSGALLQSVAHNRGWNPGETITQSVTWATLAQGSYTLKVYVSDSTGVLSNILSQPFTVTGTTTTTTSTTTSSATTPTTTTTSTSTTSTPTTSSTTATTSSSTSAITSSTTTTSSTSTPPSTTTTSQSTTTSSTTSTTSSNGLTLAWGYAPTSVAPGVYSQWQAEVFTNPGTSGSGVPLTWYLDGSPAYSSPTGPGCCGANSGSSYFGTSLSSGPHTLYFVAGGVSSSTLNICAGTCTVTTTTTTSTSTSSTSATSTSTTSSVTTTSSTSSPTTPTTSSTTSTTSSSSSSSSTTTTTSSTTSSSTTTASTTVSTSTSLQFTVLSASGGATGGTASVQSNLSTNSGSKTINYVVLSGGTVVTSVAHNRGWNPGETITQSVTWSSLSPGSYTLEVYVTDSTGTISNVLLQPFTV